MPANLIYAVLLAAGQSSRYGTLKQMASLGETTMLQSAINDILASNIHALLIVLGADAELIRDTLNNSKMYSKAPLHVVNNPNWQDGMGASLATGIRALPAEASHVLVCLGDQVALTSQHYERLLDHARANPNKIVCAQYAGINGAPAIFPRAFFADLCALKRDQGARLIIKNNPDKLAPLDLPKASIDIDTRKDMQDWLQRAHTSD